MIEDEPEAGDFLPAAPQDQRGNWVFVSHTAPDESRIRAELEGLASDRFLVLHIANRSQEAVAQDAYRKAIIRNLSRCKWFLLVMSKNAQRSPWVKFEVNWALQHKHRDLIRAVLLDGARPASIRPDLAQVRTYDCRWLNTPGPLRWVARRRLGRALPAEGTLK